MLLPDPKSTPDMHFIDDILTDFEPKVETAPIVTVGNEYSCYICGQGFNPKEEVYRLDSPINFYKNPFHVTIQTKCYNQIKEIP